MTAAVETRLPTELIDAELSRRGWAWDKLMRGGYPQSIDQIEMYLVASDRSLFVAAFLKNPETIAGSSIVRGEPLLLMDYQEESIRYPGDAIFDDGSEVGKTLEIVALLTHAAITVRGSKCLVGAPELVHILEIVDAIEDQCSMSPLLDQCIRVKRRAPHHLIVSTIGAKIHLVPAGHDGTAFRGKHVNTLAIFDEVAKAKNKKIISEFFRSCMPGCRTRFYSVPDGDRTTEFYHLKTDAKKAGDGVSLDDFKYFHRPKTIQPPPFWSPEREREKIKKHRGRHTPGYIHNVLGEDGDPENPVFPYSLWEKLITDIPEYRIISLEGNETDDSLRVEVFSVATTVDKGKNGEPSALSAESLLLTDEVHELSSFRGDDPEPMAPLLARFIPEPIALAIFFAGCDPGKINDPALVSVRQRIGARSRRVLRVKMRGVPYDIQAAVLDALREIFELKSMGLDAGGAGTALMDVINGRYDKLSEILSPMLFNNKINAVDTEGEVITDPKTDEPIRKTFRDVFVSNLALKAQRRELQEPYDLEVIKSFTSYTSRITSGGQTVYSKTDDHDVDADVQAEGGFILQLESVSFISGGVYAR